MVQSLSEEKLQKNNNKKIYIREVIWTFKIDEINDGFNPF